MRITDTYNGTCPYEVEEISFVIDDNYTIRGIEDQYENTDLQFIEEQDFWQNWSYLIETDLGYGDRPKYEDPCSAEDEIFYVVRSDSTGGDSRIVTLTFTSCPEMFKYNDTNGDYCELVYEESEDDYWFNV